MRRKWSRRSVGLRSCINVPGPECMMSSGSKEIELKLRIAPKDVVVLRKHPRFAGALHDPICETLNSVYFDSDRRLLYKNGLTLRVRHMGESG
jgi:hypothetical protein